MSIELRKLSMEQRSLLLFFETRAVDYGGKINTRYMNMADMEIAQKWAEEGLIGFGRICMNDHTKSGTHWVELTDKAWELAHEERRARYARINEKRTWMRTEEK